jgi:hypothetical protein
MNSHWKRIIPVSPRLLLLLIGCINLALSYRYTTLAAPQNAGSALEIKIARTT